MTLRMPPWEAKRLADLLALCQMMTAGDKRLSPWILDLEKRIRRQVNAVRNNRKSRAASASPDAKENQ